MVRMGEPTKKVDPPGWNDPPMLNYSESNPPPKSRIQNKRIGFSFNSTSTANNNSTNNLPGSSLISSPPKLYETGKRNFDDILLRLQDDQLKQSIEKLLEMWQGGLLTDVVQQHLCDLSISLAHKDIVKSNQLHLKLCMCSPNMSSHWQAVKSLITELTSDGQ